MDDDMILDDGFDGLPADDTSNEIEQDPSDFEQEEVEESTNETTETVEEEQKELTPQQRMLKVKVDREEREVSEDEAIPLIQKGMMVDRLVERAKQEALDTYIAKQGYTWNDKPITTHAEYEQALQEQKMMEQYKENNLPPEVIQELIESRRDREERAKEKQAKEEEAKQQKSYNEFFETFEDLNERKFDPKTDILPQEVIDAVNNGEPLQYAYMRHFNKQLRTSLKVSKQNETNSKKAPIGSVTSHGTNAKVADDDFMSGWNSE